MEVLSSHKAVSGHTLKKEKSKTKNSFRLMLVGVNTGAVRMVGLIGIRHPAV